MDNLPIGICSWSIDRHDAASAIRTARDELDLAFVQVGFFTKEDADRADAEQISALARDAGVTIAGTFAAFSKEDYSSSATLAATGGLMPDDRHDERVAMIRRVADIAAGVGAGSVAIHVGTVPVEDNVGDWNKLRDRTRDVAEMLERQGVALLLETGRESAATLAGFVDGAGRGNVAVNFDPANFVVLGTGEPARAVTTLRGSIRSVHVKDAYCSANPGVEFGSPAAIGSGDAQIPRVISKLRAVGYAGPLLIELGGRDASLNASRDAADYLRSMLV